MQFWWTYEEIDSNSFLHHEEHYPPPPHFFLNTVCMFPVNGMTFRSMHSSQTHPIHLLFKTTLSFVMLMPENGISGLQWLQKQAKARQVADLQDSDLTEEERNPLFLRDKGKYVVLLFFCVPLLFFYRGGTLVLGWDKLHIL